MDDEDDGEYVCEATEACRRMDFASEEMLANHIIYTHGHQVDLKCNGTQLALTPSSKTQALIASGLAQQLKKRPRPESYTKVSTMATLLLLLLPHLL